KSQTAGRKWSFKRNGRRRSVGLSSLNQGSPYTAHRGSGKAICWRKVDSSTPAHHFALDANTAIATPKRFKCMVLFSPHKAIVSPPPSSYAPELSSPKGLV